MPLLLFVILFGLSMDYHVFIISRIRETFDRGASMDEAVSHGIKSTAGVVTSAALVMVCVFAIFATLSMLFFKQFGVGLATAILIDATIVRAVLLPATMKLLGDWNWYLPRGSSGSPTSSPRSRPPFRKARPVSRRRSTARIPAAPFGAAGIPAGLDDGGYLLLSDGVGLGRSECGRQGQLRRKSSRTLPSTVW